MTYSRIILLLFCLIYAPFSMATHFSHMVRGVAENVGVVEGVAFSNAPNPDVTGQLTDKNGLVYSFEGAWIGDGLIGGETDTGESVHLSTRLSKVSAW